MATSSWKPLKLVWQVLCGYNDRQARREEAKIHRKLKPHNIKNEWFEYDCLIVCRNWRVNHMEEKYENYLRHLEFDEPDKFDDIVEEELDRELLVSLIDK
jgi:hypothetical protein